MLHIEDVKTAEHIGNCIHYEGPSKRDWVMSWKPEFAEKIKDNAGRIYIIVSRAPDSDTNEGVIKKIGKSECRGGMKNTFAFYQGGLGGSPSIRTFGIHKLIAHELEIGNSVEIWGIWSQPVAVQVPGLFGIEEMFVTPSIHCMEEKCRNDYKNIVGEFPPWNFQERGQPWPEFVQIAYKEQVANRPTEEERKEKKRQRDAARIEKKRQLEEKRRKKN